MRIQHEFPDVILACLGCLIITCQPCLANPTGSTLEQAQEASEKGDLNKAERLFQSLIKTSPDNWQAGVGLSRTLLLKGEIRKSIELLERLSQTHPNQERVWLNLALAQLEAGELERAETACRQAMTANPDSITPVKLIAEVKLQMGYFQFAEELAVRILESEPHERENYIFLLRTMNYVRSVPEELSLLIDLAEDNLPTDADLFYRLGRSGDLHARAVKEGKSLALAKRKNAWRLVAARAYHRACRIEPASSTYHMALARCLSLCGLKHEALAAQACALKLDENIPVSKTMNQAARQVHRDVAGRIKRSLYPVPRE